MIIVYTDDGECFECPTATGFKTDEHNNLDVTSGPTNRPIPVGCFNQGHWLRVVNMSEVDDGEES